MIEFDGIYDFAVSEDMMYAIVVYEEEFIVHICLYEKIPTAVVLNELIEELDKDDEFGLIGLAKTLDYKCMKLTESDFPDDWEEIQFSELN